MILVPYCHGLRASELVDLRWIRSISKWPSCTFAGLTNLGWEYLTTHLSALIQVLNEAHSESSVVTVFPSHQVTC
jgi:hypothetical protein